MTTYPESNALESKSRDKWVSIVVRHQSLGHLCGYVRFPRRPLLTDGYNGAATYIPVHGGITFAKEDEAGYVYGFDCGHFGDDRDPNCQDIEWVFSEVDKMAGAILLLRSGGFERRYRQCSTNKGKGKVLTEYEEALGYRIDVHDNFGVMINLLSGEL